MSRDVELDSEKLAEVALALLSLTRHGANRVWKGLDWSLMNELHERGWISDPVSKAKSVSLTDEGEELAERFLLKHFSKGSAPRTKRTDSSATVQTIDKAALDNTIALRCTAKLLKELRIKPIDVPDEIPAERQWHATILRLERRKCLLIAHTPTLYSIVLVGVRRENLARLDEEFGERARRELHADGLDDHSLVLPSRKPNLIYAKTNNRSVVGSMNDLIFQLQHTAAYHGGIAAVGEEELCKQLNRIPMLGTLGGNFAVDAMTCLLTGADRNRRR